MFSIFTPGEVVCISSSEVRGLGDAAEGGFALLAQFLEETVVPPHKPAGEQVPQELRWVKRIAIWSTKHGQLENYNRE